MSGIVGIFRLDQGPVAPLTLGTLTDFLAFRGPDGRHTWIGGPVGFGHAFLNTTDLPDQRQQPFSLSGITWIVADACLDARSDLIVKLQPQSRDQLIGVTDAELILRAYDAWGESCVEHLQGDFVFGIWDTRDQRLFCARDQLGIKPFYYAHLGSTLIFSNTLECIRQHPAVSNRLNDLAIADFLLLQFNQDPSTTTFTDIQRLPGAHTLTCSAAGPNVKRYWTMPIDDPLFLRRQRDYIERFRELLSQTIADRVRTGHAGILLSGGLDSTTVAAGTVAVLRERGLPSSHLQGLHMADPQYPPETEFAKLAADAMGIPVHFYDWGESAINYGWERTPIPAPEPALYPWDWTATRNYYRQASSACPVFLHGEGADDALHFEWQPYVSHLLAQGRYGRLALDLLVTKLLVRRPEHTVEPSNMPRRPSAKQQALPSIYPAWINPDLESRFTLRERWQTHWHGAQPVKSPHPLRPETYMHFQRARWLPLFESRDAGWTGSPLEIRHPFLDLRMLRFLMAVPALPWCKEKYLERRAMRGLLPDRVLNRAKSGLAAPRIVERIVQRGLPPLAPVPELAAYVDASRLPKNVSEDHWLLGTDLRCRSLNNWLQYARHKPVPFPA